MFAAASSIGPLTSQYSQRGRLSVGWSVITAPPCATANQQTSAVVVQRASTVSSRSATGAGRCPRAGAPCQSGDWSSFSKYSIDPVTEPHCISGCAVVPLAAATDAHGTSTSSSPTYRTAGWNTRATAWNVDGTREATVSGLAFCADSTSHSPAE